MDNKKEVLLQDLKYVTDNMSDESIRGYRNIVESGENPFPSKLAEFVNANDFRRADMGSFVIAGRIIGETTKNGIRFFELSHKYGIILVEIPEKTNAQIGDIVEVSSNKFDGAIRFPSIRVITKSLVRLLSRDDWEKMSDDFKKQHIDIGMIVEEELKKRFIQRSKINSLIRRFYEDRGFVEVETPLMQPFPEIAPVKPFVVEEPKYSQRCYLRITNTEYMRRLMVAGFDRIYQLGKCFRDEPLSFKHFPEFTQLTFGIAFDDYNALMENIEELVYTINIEVNNSSMINFRGQKLDLTPPWQKISVRSALIKYIGLDIEEFSDPDDLCDKIVSNGLSIPERFEYGGFLKMAALVDKLIEDCVRDKLVQPTFLCEYPWYLGGPAKELDDNPKYKKRSEVFIAGIELANISTPQNNPLKVRKWYKDTLVLKQESGWKNQLLDEPYLHAIDQGIPICTTGGLGIDRLMMFILGQERIEDVLLFSWRKPKKEGESI